jgi:hypothetical protein
MATSAMAAREIIRFEAGRPETVCLKYGKGKEVNGAGGPQFMFSTLDNRIFFIDPDVAWNIEQCPGAANGEPITITRSKGPRNTINWDIRPAVAGGRAEPAPAAAPAPVRRIAEPEPPAIREEPKAPAAEAPREITPFAVKLCVSMCALIDAMSEAKAYAARKRIDLTNEDLRSLAATAFIQECKGAAR